MLLFMEIISTVLLTDNRRDGASQRRGHRVVDPGGGWRERRPGIRDLLPGCCTDRAGPRGLISVEAQKMVQSARETKHPFMI